MFYDRMLAFRWFLFSHSIFQIFTHDVFILPAKFLYKPGNRQKQIISCLIYRQFVVLCHFKKIRWGKAYTSNNQITLREIRLWLPKNGFHGINNQINPSRNAPRTRPSYSCSTGTRLRNCRTVSGTKRNWYCSR